MLREKGANFEEIDLNQGLTVEQLDHLIGKRDYREFLNSRNEMYRERGMKENPPPREEALRLMSENPNLIRRPILIKGNRMILGFDEEAFQEVLQPLSPDGPFLRLYQQMPDWLLFVLIPLGYFAIMRWVLPRLGVPT